MEREPFKVRGATHCRFGHEYVWRKDGKGRYCATCSQERAKKAVPFTTRDFTKCKFGHELSWNGPGTKRICKVCAKELMRRKRQNPEYRAKQNENMNRLRKANPEYYRATYTRLRREKVRLIREHKAKSGCVRCGEKHIACLEFHHRDPSDKEVTLGSRAGHISNEKLLAEIAKCDVLCANCHRKEHWNDATANLDEFSDFKMAREARIY